MSMPKKRFQKDLRELPRAFRQRQVKNSNRFVLPTMEVKLPHLPEKEQRTTIESVGVAPGDLAYITKGPHKGTISTIFRYSKEYDAVYLAEITSKTILPKFQWFGEQNTHLVDFPKQIPRDHIKLAAKDKNEKGETVYVVAEETVYKGSYYDDKYKRWLPKRFIKHHENIEIPWPTPPQEPEDGVLSTNEETVLEKTYELQSMSVPPFPTSVLKEIRNPYSKYKSRILSELQARKLNKPTMPLSKEQQIYLAKKEKTKLQEAMKPKELSPEIQEFIGERLATHINSITNENLKIHLEALSNAKIPQ